MISNIDVPTEINTILGGESQDFIVKANRSVPLKNTLFLLGFGLFWLGFTSIFAIPILEPIFAGKEVHFTVNKVLTVAGPGNLKSLTIPALIMGLFVLIGFGITGSGIYSLLAKGAWYVGTAKRLIIYQKNKVRSIDWEQFSGDIEVSGNNDKGNISLQMRTGRMVSSSHFQGKTGTRISGPPRYVPDVIYISEIPNAFAVEQICRKRIKENDPTPPNTEN